MNLLYLRYFSCKIHSNICVCLSYKNMISSGYFGCLITRSEGILYVRLSWIAISTLNDVLSTSHGLPCSSIQCATSDVVNILIRSFIMMPHLLSCSLQTLRKSKFYYVQMNLSNQLICKFIVDIFLTNQKHPFLITFVVFISSKKDMLV